ncbi:MAG TPA: DUF2950 family protein [Planctomycetota bacterium]
MKILVWSCVAVGLLSGLGWLLAPFIVGHHHCSNERNASASLKTVASAQADYRGNDRDENKIQEFWRGDVAGLYGVLPAGSTEMIKLIEISVAGADDSPLGKGSIGDTGPGQVARDNYAVFAPKAGYYFRALRHADEDPKALEPNRFAACAYPAAYTQATRFTYILDEGNTVFQRDLGRPGPPDVFPDPVTLKRDWSKLD